MPNNSNKTLGDIWTLVTSPIGIATISYLAGIATAFVTPLFQWFFKKKEIALTNQFNSRKDKIRQWREEIERHTSLSTFRHTTTYHELMQYIGGEFFDLYLPPEIIKADNRLDPIISRCHEIIIQKEKDWGII